MINKFNQSLIIILFLLIVSHDHAFTENFQWRDITADHPLKKDIVETFLETENGYVWLGTIHSGLWVYDGYVLKNIEPGVFGLTNPDLNYIISLYETPDKNIWVGTKYNGVSIIDPNKIKAGKLQIKNNIPAQEATNRTHSFFMDENGIMWMATYKGLIKYNAANGESKLFQTDLPPHRHNNLSPSIFRCIKPDKNNRYLLWIGGINGLFSFDMKTEIMKQHRHPVELHEDYGELNFDPLHRQYLVTKIEIIDDKLYLASWGGGIMEYDPENNKWKKHLFEHYSNKNTLDENIVHDIVRSGDKLFFSTNNFAAYLVVNSNSINVIENTFAENITQYYAILKDKNEIIWWSTFNRGVFAMRTNGIKNKPAVPATLIINSIKFDNLTVYESFIRKTPDTLLMPAEINIVGFEINLINPADTGKVEYHYQLTGYDHGWISNGNSRCFEFSDLPEGNYNLMIRGREQGGSWNYAKLFTLKRKIFFYQSKWFAGIVIMVIITAIYGLYRIRILAIRKNSEIQRNLTELKLQALQAQMNPHFTFNSLNSINNFILSNNTEKASDFLTKFSRLIRQVLNNSKETMVSLRNELEALNLYMELEQLRFENRFIYKIVVDPAIDTDNVKVPPLMLQPYVENAIWHGLMHKDSEGNIEINIKLKTDHLYFSIIDDGIGREKSAQYKSRFDNNKKSLGMGITNDRIGLINSLYQNKATVKVTDLLDENNNAAGTMVEISIPLIPNLE